MNIRRLSGLLTFSVFLVPVGNAVIAADADPPDAHFAPLDFLVDHCWRGVFPDGGIDVQCYESVYDGRFIRSTHHLTGKGGMSYGGVTMFSWDGERQRIRFHYFTSTGAVSEGHFEIGDGGILIPERHVDDEGKVTELETRYVPLGTFEYRVSTRQRQAGDAGWSTLFEATYRRTDAPDSQRINAAIHTEAGEWRLVWSRSVGDGWAVVTQNADGQVTPVPGAGGSGKRTGDAWAWAVHGQQLLLLGKWGDAEHDKGWRAARWSPGMSAPTLIAEDRVSDSSFDCHPSGWPCALNLRDDQSRRILLIDDDGERRLLDNGGDGDSDATWSPDGQKLLWRSNRGGSWELWLGDADGGHARALTHDDANNAIASHAYGGEGPARFSPDGRHIVWTRRFPDIGFDVWIMDADGSNPRNLTPDQNGNDAYPSVSPDGQWIAFDSDRSGDSEIYRMRLDGSGVERISFHPGYEGAPMWRLAKPTAGN